MLRQTLSARLVLLALIASSSVAVADQATKPLAVSTIAGIALQSGSNDSPNARFFTPVSIATDRAGNVYVLDTNNHTVRKIAPGGTVSTLAGVPGQPGSNDSPNARFNHPVGMVATPDGTLYVTDLLNHTVRKITPDGTVSTVAGTVGVAGSFDGVGLTAQFNGPENIVVDKSGSLIVADTFNHLIRKVSPSGVVSTIAGMALVSGVTDSPGALFNYPIGVAVDSAGNILVSDSFNHTIRRISPTGVVSTIAGLPGSLGYANGSGNVVRFNVPTALAIDKHDNLFVTDTRNHVVRKITKAGEVSTVAGTGGVAGIADGIAEAARFNTLQGIAVFRKGFGLYVSDTENHTVRKLVPVEIGSDDPQRDD